MKEFNRNYELIKEEVLGQFGLSTNTFNNTHSKSIYPLDYFAIMDEIISKEEFNILLENPKEEIIKLSMYSNSIFESLKNNFRNFKGFIIRTNTEIIDIKKDGEYLYAIGTIDIANNRNVLNYGKCFTNFLNQGVIKIDLFIKIKSYDSMLQNIINEKYRKEEKFDGLNPIIETVKTTNGVYSYIKSCEYDKNLKLPSYKDLFEGIKNNIFSYDQNDLNEEIINDIYNTAFKASLKGKDSKEFISFKYSVNINNLLEDLGIPENRVLTFAEEYIILLKDKEIHVINLTENEIKSLKIWLEEHLDKKIEYYTLIE